MADKMVDKTAAQQTELELRQLDSLEISPAVAAICFSKLLEPQFASAALGDVVESDPALAAKALSLLNQHGISLAEENLTLRQAVDRLPPQALRYAIFRMKVSGDSERASEAGEVSRADLTKHSLAAACCAAKISQAMSPKMDAGACYCAGLLHDIGKIAMQQVMPKSFAIITQEAKQQQVHSCTIEQKHLGLDHTIFGKRLAQKWHLPEDVGLAIWLHHSDTTTILQNVTEAKIAHVVQLADLTVRKYGIGKSGSYDSVDSASQIAQSLGISPGQLEEIGARLEDEVTKKATIPAISEAATQAVYLNVLHKSAVKLAEKQSNLDEENQQLRTAASHLNFIAEFLSSVGSADTPIDIAENFAVRWQKFYQTGMVCLYLTPQAGSNVIEAALVESLSKSRAIALQTADDATPVPPELAKNFGVLNAYQHIGWLLDQLDVNFDASQTKLMPLRSAGKTVGAIAFELRYPSDVELFVENFKMAASVAGLVLDLAARGHTQEQFAERFLQLVGKSETAETVETVETPASEAETIDIEVPEEQPQEQTYSLSALAEMAGGAAHELNNPLAVISGRAQLLSQAETDPDKKRMLKQIHDNASDITRITEDLLAFAEPPQPKSTPTQVRQMLDEAVQLAAMKAKVEALDVAISVADSAAEVYVDSAQIASAIANVLCNGVESYPDKNGHIEIAAQEDLSDGFIKLEIADSGRGMDEETLRKATQPFFSNRPAGRSRGMGLAHTQRLVELNGGSLQISSQPSAGTIVTISLPTKPQ
jgi:putative nucleotidyltransferase with HDIG domain